MLLFFQRVEAVDCICRGIRLGFKSEILSLVGKVIRRLMGRHTGTWPGPSFPPWVAAGLLVVWFSDILVLEY